MPANDAPFRLTTKQRTTLQQLVRVIRDARLLRRCQALLWRADGESIATIAGRLGVSRQTVHNWVARFETRSGVAAERIADGERSGRPASAHGIIDLLLADLIDDDPRAFGYAATAWTAPLLQKHLAEQHHLEVSVISVRRAIHQ